jgi:hypothetical protein
MTQWLHIGAALLGLGAILLIAQCAAWLLTEWRGAAVNIKPLNCRPCMTFWLTLAVLLAALFCLRHLTDETAIDAVLFAFINFFYIKTKITVYE